jgi:hypothetical protein
VATRAQLVYMSESLSELYGDPRTHHEVGANAVG